MTKYERAKALWPLLVEAARERRTYTYSDLAPNIGVRGGRPMANYLGPIMHFCEARTLPPLTAVVVNKTTGLPGPGLTASKDPEKDKLRVFAFDWRTIDAPTAEELQLASKPTP